MTRPDPGPRAAPPLGGRRIVLTRPEAEARGLADRMAALGAEVIVVPAIQIAFADPALLDAALADLARYDWVIFTSRNAVEATFRRAGRLAGPKIAAVGPGTAAALHERGTSVDLVPREATAEALADAIGECRGARVLFPRADIARRALPDGLRRRGAVVDEVVAYHTRPDSSPRPDLRGVDAVTFASSSAVRGFLDQGPVPPGAVVVCIGPTTARTARERGLEVARVAEDHGEDGLVAAVVAALNR